MAAIQNAMLGVSATEYSGCNMSLMTKLTLTLTNLHST